MPRPHRHVAIHLGAALGAVVTMTFVPVLLWRMAGRGGTLLLPALALAVLAFLLPLGWKLVRWMRAPIPFHVPLTTGQQRSLSTLPRRRFDSPHSPCETFGRAVLDLLCFRPLARATPSATHLSPELAHGLGRWLWLGAMAFHLSLAVVLLGHVRLFAEPVPKVLIWIERLDRATSAALPAVHLTSLLLLLALAFLLGRRLVLPRLRAISLTGDYLPLFLLAAIAISGLAARHIARTDVTGVKRALAALARGSLVTPLSVDGWLVAHLSLVATLAIYLPWSKLVHAPGALMSTTLTVANDTRARRHINVRNPSVTTLHYADYEATFRDRMIEAGLPVEER
jgi:nitrate reductase gamma subunit